MKKFTYLLAAAAVMAACNGNKGYTVTGTVEGAADGDTVYLKMAEGRQLVSLDSAVIANGTTQPSPKSSVTPKAAKSKPCKTSLSAS